MDAFDVTLLLIGLLVYLVGAVLMSKAYLFFILVIVLVGLLALQSAPQPPDHSDLYSHLPGRK